MESLLPLAAFAFVTSVTPGPNNLMLAASGIGFGLRRTVPHLLGVGAGFALLLLVCASGIGAVITALPGATELLKIAGSAYLIYLAWQLRHSGLSRTDGPGAARPMSFMAAVLFQFVNPKAWVMALTCASVFLPELGTGMRAILLLTLVAAAVNLPCVGTWAVLGASLRRLLHQPVWAPGFSTLVVGLQLYAALAIWI
jgi:threonine/homoserine/homoserine lactone efflux protein